METVFKYDFYRYKVIKISKYMAKMGNFGLVEKPAILGEYLYFKLNGLYNLGKQSVLRKMLFFMEKL